MKKIRVLTAATPRMLGDIVRNTLEGQPDIEIVGRSDGIEGLAAEAGRARPDLVIVADRNDLLPEPCLRLMYDHTRLKIVVVTPDGRSASIHRLVPDRTPIRDVSPQGLLDAIRATFATAPEA